jgi:hypothetical protein
LAIASVVLAAVLTACLNIKTEALPTMYTGVPVSVAMEATGGTPPYRWAATGLPGGLTINSSTGVL